MTARVAQIDDLTALERFVREYADTAGGAWDEIEPQVYDLLLPGKGQEDDADAVVRLAFDPEAIPEHPGAQLATLGAPLVDRMLAEAISRGSFAEMYAIGLNLYPHALSDRVASALSLSANISLHLRRVRAMHFPQALFWFEAAITSDQKEQELLCVGVDLHYGRQVRHTELLVDRGRLAAGPAELLPEAPHQSTRSGYLVARQRAARTVASLANARRRELDTRVQKQAARMQRYYQQLRAELEDQTRRGPAQDPGKRAARVDALAREEQLRLAELQAKTALRVKLRLLSVLLVRQPKLLVNAALVSKEGRAAQLELVWDPLTETVEAPCCLTCGQPSYSLAMERNGVVTCPVCTMGRRQQ